MTPQLSHPQVRTIKIQVQGGANNDCCHGTGARLNDGKAVAVQPLHSLVIRGSPALECCRVVYQTSREGILWCELFFNETDTRQDGKELADLSPTSP